MINRTHKMLPFTVTFQTGRPAYEQVVFAAKKAIASGQLRPGDRFPSVRSLSKELTINPNTAHKVIANLKAEGLLEVVPGIGTIISESAVVEKSTAREQLRPALEKIVVDATQLSLSREDIEELLKTEWDKISNQDQTKS